MISKERAREIALEAGDRWMIMALPKPSYDDYLADALHAAYEAEQAKAWDAVCAGDKSARLSSIKDTARAIWQAHLTSTEGSNPMLHEAYEGQDKELALDCDAAVRFAEALESAFERRYGGGA